MIARRPRAARRSPTSAHRSPAIRKPWTKTTGRPSARARFACSGWVPARAGRSASALPSVTYRLPVTYRQTAWKASAGPRRSAPPPPPPRSWARPARLFAERGYAAVGTPEIAAAAGVTRGAMYHQFADKAALFGAVAEAVESDVTRRLGEYVGGQRRAATRPRRCTPRSTAGSRRARSPRSARCCCSTARSCSAGTASATWRCATGSALTEAMLQAAIDAGQLGPQPTPGARARADRRARRGGDVRRDGR